MRPTNSTRNAALLLTVAMTLGLAACGANSTEGSDRASSAEGRAAAEAPEASGGGDAPADDGVNLVAAAQDRRVISTADVELDVDDLDRAVGQARSLATRVGGVVFAEDTVRQDGARTVLTLKVPPSRFEDVLAELADLGDVSSQQITTDDVTEQVVSLESRITTAEASVIRLQALMARSERIEDITALEGELLTRETTLETLRGEQRTLERQVELATITASMASVDAAPVADEARDLPSFLDGLAVGWNALLIVGAALLAALGALAPWVPLALVGLIAARAWRRSRPPRPQSTVL